MRVRLLASASLLSLVSVATALTLGGCGSSTAKARGTLGAACYADNLCNAELTCIANVCVPADGGSLPFDAAGNGGGDAHADTAADTASTDAMADAGTDAAPTSDAGDAGTTADGGDAATASDAPGEAASDAGGATDGDSTTDGGTDTQDDGSSDTGAAG